MLENCTQCGGHCCTSLLMSTLLHRQRVERSFGYTLWHRALRLLGRARSLWPGHGPRLGRGCLCNVIKMVFGSTTTRNMQCLWHRRHLTCPQCATSQYSRCCPVTPSASTIGSGHASTAATRHRLRRAMAHMHPMWHASLLLRAGAPSMPVRLSLHCPAPLNSFFPKRGLHPGDGGIEKKKKGLFFFGQHQLDKPLDMNLG